MGDISALFFWSVEPICARLFLLMCNPLLKRRCTWLSPWEAWGRTVLAYLAWTRVGRLCCNRLSYLFCIIKHVEFPFFWMEMGGACFEFFFSNIIKPNCMLAYIHTTYLKWYLVTSHQGVSLFQLRQNLYLIINSPVTWRDQSRYNFAIACIFSTRDTFLKWFAVGLKAHSQYRDWKSFFFG